MLKNLEEGSAELGWAPFANVPERLPYADFLPILLHGYAGIYISNNLKELETIDWKLYLNSFSLQLWLMLFITAFILALTIFIMEWLLLKQKQV